MNKIQLTVFILLALFFTASYADVYKWTDDKGQVHYTQYKPLKYKSELVKGAPPPSTGSQDVNKSHADQIDQRGKDRRQEQEKNKQAASKSDFNSQQCDTAKNNLATLQGSGRVSYQNASGESVIMSQEEMDAQIAQTKKQIQFYCE